ncbi:hypothetical protein EVB32_018 [Rhizobium phage RHph_TM39]|uniref:VWA domain-containing protein n=1 Tax=Rhizobium phage RHph_TM30 TaxID=2509764 RepID=A0A7S5RAN6_9CAUD|nr:hypothetical protein PQC16_gp018 [Rhizobium phage RHph_TM30]QIG71125.1 hypothetical protein EVB93_018 [Rhizobium phage RHph_TM30]QIG77006.1 hypothetical protein EVB32_018 [Rhizobium phage RHph_TM39]
MGGGRFDTNAYASLSTARTVRTDGTRMHHTEVFKAKVVDSKFSPRSIKIRESVDSETSPNSRPIIVGLDFSGSMGSIAGEMANNQLGKLMENVVGTKAVADPHLLFLGIDDVHASFSSESLQATQFEADIRIAEQLTELKNIGRGGGNGFESYNLAWYFAAYKTKIDSFKKRGKKGLLFTIGDEGVPADLNASHLETVFGSDDLPVLSNDSLLSTVRQEWDVFHIIAEEGDYCRGGSSHVSRQWYGLLGNRAILMSDYRYVSDIIVATIAVNEGRDPDDLLSTYKNDGSREVIERALYGMRDFAKSL